MARRLLLLNGLAVLGLAFHHAAAFGFQAMFLWTDRYLPVTVPNYDQLGSLAYYGLLLVRQLDHFTLPAFMFVSGYFIAFAAGGGQSRLTWMMVMLRIRNFLIPFILWTVVHYILLRRLPSSLEDVFRPYYYIPLLMQYYLLSPIIVPLTKHRWKLLLFVLAFIEMSRVGLQYFTHREAVTPALEQMIRIRTIPTWLVPHLSFWFVLGIVVGVHRQQFTEWLARIKWGLLVAVIVLGSLTIFEYIAVAHFVGKDWLGPSYVGITTSLYAFAFILCFLAFNKSGIPFSKELSSLGSKSLGVYLANTPAIYVIAVMMYKLTPWVLGHQLIYQVVLITVGLGVPVLLMAVLSKSPARGVYRYVFG